MKRTGFTKKAPPGGFHEKVKLEVSRRSKGICEVGSRVCTGKAQHYHHRKLRRSKDHRAINCLHVCNACHSLIHDREPRLAMMMGWLVSQWGDPATVPVIRGEKYKGGAAN